MPLLPISLSSINAFLTVKPAKINVPNFSPKSIIAERLKQQHINVYFQLFNLYKYIY